MSAVEYLKQQYSLDDEDFERFADYYSGSGTNVFSLSCDELRKLYEEYLTK